MVKTQTIEGLIDGMLRFHFDVEADVLYLRRVSHEQRETYADVTDEGDLLLRDAETDEPAGLTIISWWKRFGTGPIPDSISELLRHVEPFSARVGA